MCESEGSACGEAPPKPGWSDTSAYMARRFGVALKPPAGFELAEGSSGRPSQMGCGSRGRAEAGVWEAEGRLMEQETRWIRTKCGTRGVIKERLDSCQMCFMIARMSGLGSFNVGSKRKCQTLLAGKRHNNGEEKRTPSLGLWLRASDADGAHCRFKL